jgi:hypothetical protein
MARPKIAVVDDPLEAASGSEGPQRKRRPPKSSSLEATDQPAAISPSAESPEEQPPSDRPRARSERRGRPRPALDLQDEALVAVFGRVPATLARRLEGVVFELRAERKVSQQDVLAALLLRYIDPHDERSLAEIRAGLETYYEARDGRRVRPAYAE